MQSYPLETIVTPLLEWYRTNKRMLPWRENTDPYRVWVSEIMLQQTRVEAVIPYYNRFMECCPDIAALAVCEDETLMKLWEGLGYYSRARNLKKAAQVICAQYQGKFPEALEDIIKLPGIGAYTAGAVASIAFGQAAAAVDGNVLRVIARLTEDKREIADGKFRKEIAEALEQVYPEKGRGDFTQSLMELGAVVCVPNGVPKCKQCPLNAICGANAHKTQQQYPVKKKKTARKIEQKTVLLLCCGNQIAIRKRSGAGVLSGMWELPNLEGSAKKEEILSWLAQQRLDVEAVKKPKQDGNKIKHIFTHIEWHMAYWMIDCKKTGAQDALVWVTRQQLQAEIALPTAFKRVLEAALQTEK